MGTKPHYYKGRIINLLLRSHEEMRTLTHLDNDQLLSKNSTVYEGTKMIEIETQTNYKFTLNSTEFRQLYNLLKRLNNDGQLQYDQALIPVLNEMRKLFPAEEAEDNEKLPYFVGN